MPPIIEASDVTKEFRNGKITVRALKGISLSIERGEFVSLVGPSGSGKSTFFHILGGLTSATSGSVVVDGIDLTKLSDGARTRVRGGKIGFVFQRFNLLPTLTARGNIEIAFDIAGRDRSSEEPYLLELAGLLNIRERLRHRPSELSGGEQQRVAIARALITRPAIVLADEPTGALDTENSNAVLDMLRKSNRDLGQTILMITHNLEAAQIADRIVQIRDGSLVANTVQ